MDYKQKALSIVKLKYWLFAAVAPMMSCTEPTGTTVVYLEQGWNSQNQYREISYNLSQGSNLIPYDWYLALEIPQAEVPLSANTVIEALQYLPTNTASILNPDNLPVGFVKNIDAQNKAWMGVTCAACHTGEIHFNNARIRIDGGPAMGDFIALLKLVQASISDTLVATDKFERFAQKLYGQDWAMQADGLKLELQNMEKKVTGIIRRDNTIVQSGYGRLDAFGSIGNELFVDDVGIAGNFSQANAPVDYPFLWDTPNLERVQWVGNVENPFARNVGEVFGVFGEVNLVDDTHLFSSSVQYENIYQLEEMLRSLRSPQWPESILGSIDPIKAARGEVVYQSMDANGYTCVSCHTLPDANGDYPLTPAADNLFGKQFIKTYNIPLAGIGTDPNTANQIFSPPLVDIGLALTTYFAAQNKLPRTLAQSMVVGESVKKALSEIVPPLTDLEKAAYVGYRVYAPGIEREADIAAYKARPLNGIWATAPYLHNGSVRTLSMLLASPAQREVSFWKKSREFDPVNIGFQSIQSPKAQLFDTSLPGNFNTGHDYGTSFSAADKSDLIEFMKTL